MARGRNWKIERYFTPPPPRGDLVSARWWMAQGVGAMLLPGILLVAVPSVWMIWLPLMGAGGYRFWQGHEKEEAYKKALAAALPKPEDEIVDVALARCLRGIEDRALARLELTVDDLELESDSWDPLTEMTEDGDERLARKPYTVAGPVSAAPAVIGLDGVWRFAQYEVLVICPTDYHLALYRCVIDLRVDGYQDEETVEYHYEDVVAVSTGNKVTTEFFRPIDLRIPGALTGPTLTHAVLHKFEIVVSSGDRRTVVFDMSDRDNPNRKAALPFSGNDQVLRAVRRMLRDKKSSKDTL